MNELLTWPGRRSGGPVRRGRRAISVPVAALMVACLPACTTPLPRDSDEAMPGVGAMPWKSPRMAPRTVQADPAAVGAVGTLPPIALTRAVAPETIGRLRAEAESWYRTRNSGQAIEAFSTLVELVPTDGQAWLRLGNLHQQNNDNAAAARAYRKAADVRSAHTAQVAIRRKALVNLALLGLDRARQALQELEGDPMDAETAAAHQQIIGQYRQLQGQVDVSAQGQLRAASEPVAPPIPRARERRVRDSDGAETGGQRAAAIDPDDARTGLPRPAGSRPLRRAGPTKAGVQDDGAAADAPVRIEYLSGGPRK